MMGLDGVPSRLKTPVTDFVLQKSQGGGWCNSTESCSERKMTEFGSSKFMEALEFTGILSNQQQYSLFSQVNWGRLEMKPERNKFKVHAH